MTMFQSSTRFLNEVPMYCFRNCNVPIQIFPLLTLASVAYGKLVLNPNSCTLHPLVKGPLKHPPGHCCVYLLVATLTSALFQCLLRLK